METSLLMRQGKKYRWLSPEAETLFKARLRRNQTWSDAGFNAAHAWLN